MYGFNIVNTPGEDIYGERKGGREYCMNDRSRHQKKVSSLRQCIKTHSIQALPFLHSSICIPQTDCFHSPLFTQNSWIFHYTFHHTR
mmetsp:Transcript_53937/g.63063  ORF Transcript_53937/g.63063 Transcript_53937/m.63063 type:complete len:87 (-) Transcript_53937:1029-1289(-)